MCCSLAPAHFTKTTLYAAEVQIEGGLIVHVMGYQNVVQNLAKAKAASSNWGWGDVTSSGRLIGRPTGNAMILPFPAVPGSMTEQNVLSTERCPNILKNIAAAVQPPIARGGMLRGGKGVSDSRVVIFEHDIYTVVLATDPRLIGKVLDAVPEEKRPNINNEILDAYARWYPDWPVALCCFNNEQAAEAKPLLWWFNPAFQSVLFAPGLDGHDGKMPNLAAEVKVDHTVAFGSYVLDGSHEGNPVHYERTSEEVAPYLTRRVIGQQFIGTMPNGDFVARTDDVRSGTFSPRRLAPPGVAASALSR